MQHNGKASSSKYGNNRSSPGLERSQERGLFLERLERAVLYDMMRK